MLTYVWPNILDCNCMYRGWSNYYLLFTHTHTHMHPKHEFPLNFSFQKSRVMKQFPLLSLQPQMHLFSLNHARRPSDASEQVAGLLPHWAARGSAWYLYLSDPFVPHFAHIVGARSGGAGGWQLAFKNANPTTLKGPDNSWGPHQFVYSSVIRSRHLDCAPAEHRQPCRVERGARCDRGPRRGE